MSGEQVIHWPALLRSEQGADYIYMAEPTILATQQLCVGDQLIDSQGQVSLLSQTTKGRLIWQLIPKRASLPELAIELQEYAANLGICCTSKLVVSSFAQAIALVAWLDEQ